MFFPVLASFLGAIGIVVLIILAIGAVLGFTLGRKT